MSLAHPPGPSPWLTWVVTVALAVGSSLATTTYSAGEKAAELRHTQAQVEELKQAMGTIVSRANATDVSLGNISTELRFIRQDIADVKSLLQGRSPKYLRGE